MQTQSRGSTGACPLGLTIYYLCGYQCRGYAYPRVSLAYLPKVRGEKQEEQDIRTPKCFRWVAAEPCGGQIATG